MRSLLGFKSLLLLLCALAPARAHGLRFDDYKTKAGRTVLIVRDCGRFSAHFAEFEAEDKARSCLEPETSFTQANSDAHEPLWEGDAEILERKLAAHERAGDPYTEVWLNSGGGDVSAGIGVANALRSHQMTVRIPSGFDCVSSCTIAFMGGWFRYLEEGGKYRVHSASSFQGVKVDDERVQEVMSDPDAKLLLFARFAQKSERYLAIQLFYVFQNTLILTKPGVHPPADPDAMKHWALEGEAPPLAYTEAKNAQHHADVVRIKSEGVAALPDILMRIERDAMAAAVVDVEQATGAVPRAKPALLMLQTMYMTSIRETSTLNRSTMLERGYLTDDAVVQ